MARNYFDQASRFTAKLDPVGFWSWSLRLKPEQFVYRRWLETRNVPFPGGDDRTGDTVAWLDNPAENLTPWAVAAEFQIEPDPLMFGRMMVYLGNLWMALKPDIERGSRFQMAAIVMNLTGNGTTSRRMEWPAAGLTTILTVTERNMARENADELLAGVEGGVWSKNLLPWLPLMAGGDDSSIIERWKKLAEAEPNSRLRSEYGGLAMVFAEAAKCKEAWAYALKGWNMRESTVVNEWRQEGRAEGRTEGRAESIIDLLEDRFGQIPPELTDRINSITSISTLKSWLPLAAKVNNLEEFLKETQPSNS